MTKLLTLMILAAALLPASTLVCPPSFVSDSLTVSAGCPGVGAQVYALPGSSGFVAFNDNPLSQGTRQAGTGDFDINDAAITFQLNQAGDQITVAWFAGLSAWPNSVTLAGHTWNSAAPAPQTFGVVPGSLLDFRIVTPQGTYGTGWNNGLTWDYATQAGVPEPASLALVGLALLVAPLVRRLRRA